MAERPLYTLYKNLKAQNYDVPDDYNKFESALTRDGKGGADNRHAIYENLKAQNFDVPSTYERFYSALFEPRSKTSSRAKGGSVPMSAADRARFSAGAAAISASAQQTMNNAGRHNRLKQRKQKQQKAFGRVNLGTHQTPYGGDANNVVKDDFAYNSETGKTGAYVTSDSETAYTQNDAEKKQNLLDKYGEEWTNAVDMGIVPSELDKADPDLSDTDVAMRQMERRQEWLNENQGRRSKELNESMHLQGSPFVASGGAVAPSSFNTAISNEANRLSDVEYGAYNTAKAYNQMLRTTLLQELKEQKQRNENAGWWKDKWNDVSNYFGAMFNTMLAPKLYSQGVMDAAISNNLLQVKKGMEDGTIKKGSNAGNAAQAMLAAIQQQQGEAAKQQQYGTKAYLYGDMSGRSLKFMADFGLSGWRNVITTGFTKAGEKMALGALGKWFTKNTGRVLGDMAGSAALAATNQLGSTYNNVIERYVGMNNENGGVTKDKNGDLKFNEGVSLGKAIKDGFGSATIENFSEMFGEYLPGAPKLLSKLGLSKVSSFFEKIGNNAYYKWLSNATNKSGIQGVMAEISEEEFGTALHAAWGDGDGSWSDFNVFTNPDAREKQIDTCLGMFYSVGFMQAPRTAVGAINAVQYFNIKHQVAKADKFGQVMFNDKWDEIKSKIDVTTNADLTKTVLDATRSDSMTAKQKGAVINYAMFLSKLRGFNQAADAKTKDKVEEGDTAPTLSNDLDDAYTEGHNADDSDKHNIQLEQNDKANELAAMLHITPEQLHDMADEDLEAMTGQDDKLDQAIYDYQVSTAKYQGVMDGAQDEVDMAAHQAAMETDNMTDLSRGTVRKATIKAAGGLEDYEVYIISGNIATHDDGSIDVGNSDDMIIYYDPTTGRKEHADAMMFADLIEELPAADVKAQAINDAKENAIKKIAGIIDGTVEVGSQFSVTDADGTEHTYEVLADNGDGTAMITIDGNVPTELVKGENVQIPYSFADLQQMKDMEDKKRLEAAKDEREQMENERAAQQNQETEQTEEIQPSFDFTQILNDNGNVVLADVLGKDGNTKYPNSQLFLIRDSGAKAKVMELTSDGSLIPHAVNKKDVRTATTMTLDEYKQAMPATTMIEDNSGVDRGEIEVEAPTIEDAEPIGTGAFGNIYNQFKGKVKEAFNFLMHHKSGDLLGVFHRDDVGDIDLVWGNEKMGLAHILGKHVGEGKDFETPDDAIAMIENVINSGRIFQDNQNRYTLMLDGVGVGIRKSFDGEKKNWIVTAVDFNRSQEEKGIVTNPTSTSHGVTESESAAALNDSDGKDINNSANDNENNESLTFEDGTPIPVDENGETDLSQTDAAHAAEWYDNNLGEDADDWLDGEIKKAKKVLEQAQNKKLAGTKPSELVASKKEKEAAIADAQAHYDSAISIRDSLKERRITKEENTAEGRKNLIEKARRKFARLKSAVKDDAEAVAQIYKETVGTLLHRLYDGTGIDVTDTIPLTAEEYVASNLGAHSLNYEGTETSKGVKQETGLSIEDFAKTKLLAAVGKGTTIDNLVHSLWENRPSNLDSLDTQDIRNALLSIITSGFKASEARNYIENLRIAQAENILEEQKKAAENAAFAEENKAEAEQQTETAPESEEKTGEENSDEINDEENEQTNENINAPEVPEDATEENPLGEQKPEEDLPFSAKENGKQQTTAERAADVEKNKVDDVKVVDNIVGEKTRKAFERLAKMMGASIQWQYSDKLGNGWIQETMDADGNVHRTIFITLDSSITEGAQFIFGHEMTHQIKHLNPAAYNELTQLVLDTYGSDAFDKAVDETMKRYSDAGFSGRARDYYAEEVVADAVGEMIRDLNLAHTLAMKMSHPLLAAIHEILQKIKLAFFGTEYSDVTKNIIRSIEQAYVKTAKGEVTNSETGEDVSFSLRQKPEPKKKGIGYKVFVLKDGKLYPPMVANPDGAATPVGVWLDADAAPIAGESKTGRPQVKQGGKGTQGGSGKLAYRPGWHLGVVPYAIQFNRKDADGNKTLFPKNFVFAEVEYAADVDYQEEARQEGINPSGKYQHSLAGLKHLPTDGYYMYRTNPNPETDPWVITGAMKVNRILTRAEQAELVKNAGREPQQIQDGDIVTDDVVNSINQEIADAPKFSLKVYHGSGADFTEFDFDHMGEGAGSQVFGWGGYVTSSKKIGKSYANLVDANAPYQDVEYVGNNAHEYTDVVAGLFNGGQRDYDDVKEFLQNGYNSDKENARKKQMLEWFESTKPSDWKSVNDGKRNLYEVDIPEDNGSNYLDWEGDVPSTLDKEKLAELILDKTGAKEKVARFKATPAYLKGLEFDIKKLINEAQTGQKLYTNISSFVSEKDASKILSALGFTGIKYPAGTIMGGAEEGDTNYVIFKPEDMKITEHTKFSIKTYHGSQASFDKFDHSFMGSGEGAQAYGWGTYVSEVEGIAKAYAKQNTAKKNTEYTKAKNAYEIALADIDFHNNILDGFKKDIEYQKENIAQKQKMIDDISKYIENTDKDSEKYKDGIKTIEQMQKIIDRANKTIESTTSAMKDRQEMLDLSIKERDEAKAKLDSTEKPKRNLYSVDIPDDTGDNYLGWDEPLNAKQIDMWKKALLSAVPESDRAYYEEWADGMLENRKKENNPLTGKDAYYAIDSKYASKKTSMALSKAGFVGVKVIAQRNTGGNKEGKMNYVIFDENNAQITSHTKLSLKKDGLTPEIANTPVNIVDADEEHGFKNYAEAREWAKKNIVRTYNDEETGGKGEINISNTAVGKYLSEKAIDKSISKDVHMSVLKVLPSVLRESVDAYQHGDRKKVNNVRSEKFGINPDVMIHRCFGAVNIGGKVYGVKITLKENVKTRENKKLYSYEATKIELLDGKNEGVTMTPSLNSNNSITVAKIAKVFETAKKNGEKFSLKDEKTLVGVHNITEEKLRKALKLGGFANPSLAVIDTNKTGHDNFGEISFIAPSALLDKRTGKTGGTWITDAYTQRYPSVEREMSEKGSRKFRDWVDSLEYPSEAKAVIKRQAEDALSNNNAPAWELMYLKEKGIDIKEYDSRIDYRWKEIISDHPTAEDILNSMKTDPELNEKVTSLAKHAIIHPTWEKVSLEVRRKMYKETGVKASPINPQVRKQTKEIFERDYAPTLLNKDGSPRKKDVKKVVEDIVKEHNDTKKYDFYLSKVKASNYVNKNGLYDDYIRWQENKLDEFGTKNRIFRGYKNDGSLKYVPETLENVSKAMREDADGQTNGSEYTSFGSFIAKLASRVDSTDEMRANKDKLSSNKDKEEFYEKWSEVYYDLAKFLYNDVFYGEQRLHDIVLQSDPKKYAKKEYGITLTPTFMKKLDALKNAVQTELKSAYFETKYNRPLRLNEFAAAVVPDNLGEDVRKGIENAGLPMYDYDPNKEGDRSRAFNEAINSSDNIRFSLAGERGAAAADKAEERTFRMDNLSVARKMEEEKKDAKAIKMATGWERGADGKWRYEMPDAKIKDTMDVGGGHIVKRYEDDMLWNGGKLSNVIDAPELFKAYPQLKDVRIDTDAIMNDMPSNGEYNSKTNTITIHADELKYMNDILNHEIQHVIQGIEGFATGGSPTTIRGEVKKRFDEVTKQIKQLRAEGKEDEAKALIEKNRGLYNAYTKNDDFNSYKSLAGEVEARNVSARLNMTPEERRKTLAESTEDVARKDQIFLGVGDVSFSLRDMADGKESGAADMVEDLKSLNTPDEVDDAIKTAIDDMSSGWQIANKKMIHIAQVLGENRKAEIAGEEPKFSLKDGTLIKAGTYFSGGGLVEEGLKGIIDPVIAVEYDEKISGVYRNNFGQHIVTADVRDVDPKELVKQIDGEVEYFHASPVCKNYSQAKSNHAEVELDKETAASTAEFINAVKPKVVTIENVKGYKDSEAMKIITDALDANGYTWDADVYNAADYGGYTNRERLIVRAVRDGKLPAKPKKMARKSGWYEAVADIIPTLTEKKNGVAPWMDVRLKADGIDWRNIDKPLYVMGSAYADGKIPHAFADELLPTLRTKSGDVIVMPDGKVYRAMGRVLARVSGVSDDYKMPFSENLSHTIIGNGIPTQLTEHVIAPLLQNTLRPTTPEDGNTKFSLRYDQFEHDLNQWKKDNNLPKDAQRPTIPQRNAGESAVDFLRRVDEYRKQMALWKTAPTYEQHLLSDDTALGEFNRELQRGSVLKRIAFQDSMLAIRKAQEAIMKEVGVDRLNMAEDAYTAENRSHGKGKNEFEEYNNEFLQPLRKAYHQMKKILGDSYDNVRIYMMAKHGLERDAQMAFKKSLDADFEDVAQRSAAYRAYKGDMNRITNDSDLEFGRVDFNTWRQRDNALRTKYSPSYMDYRYDENGIAYDYSGLSALFGGSDFEEAAHKLVRDIESSHVAEVQDLWNATNAATKKILRDGYKAGMMSKDTYQYVRDMYSHYIPLRGWDGTTADQVWDYVGGGKGAFNQTLKTAHGRTSIADDPIAYIENMAESGILLNNKNWVKQHLMLLAQNHPTSLLTLSKAWYVKSTDANGNEEWIPATPQITSQMNSNQVKAAIDAFEQKMENMAQTGDATQQRDGLNIAYPQTHSEEREHEVRVMKDGEEYVIYVNGDPQLAQAMNNTRAHRVSEGIKNSISKRVIAVVGRKMAAAYTSLSPLFIPSNYFRDLTMTLASTAIREDAKYNYLLGKNLTTSWNLGFMLRDFQNGKLRDKVNNGNATPKEQMFYDFMMNGGETGFVSSLDVEDLKKKFKNDLKDLDRWKANPVKVGHTIMDGIEFLNRAIEDSNRFAVYMTSIKYGRSIDEAVNDAKDVTLNFNRKGTGEHSWQTIRNLYLFINPAVQSLQTLGALAKHHPFKFTAVTASWIASGVLVPIVNAALMQMAAAFLGGDGDDDKDWYKDISKKYWQFSKWDRRNNFIMWVPTTHEFVKIPLAQEFRAFYGLGDMIASKMMGGELAEESWEDYGWDLVGQVVDMLPLDPTGYDGELGVSLMPNPIRPVFELAFNVDFTGKPLFKDTEYNKYDPNFTKAYVGTPDWLVRASRMMNSIGNDYPDVQQNSIDAFGDPRYNLNNPAVVDHVLSSYLGGAYTMGSQVLGLLTKSLNDRKEIKMADIPVLSKFVSNPDDRPVSKKQGDEFWDKKEYYDRAANTISKLKKQAKIDGDYSLLERFYGSEEYKKYKLYEKDVNEYKEARKKERAEESGDEYRPHQLNAEDIYKNHATPMDEFEEMKLKQLFEKLNSFKTRYDAIVDNAPNESDGYYNTNKAAIDAIDDISLDKQEISELKKGFLDDGKDAYNAEDMKQIRELRKKILAVLEKANKVVVANQKAKAEK